MKCQFVSHAISTGRSGDARLHTRCTTHDWPMENPYTVSTEEQCPIGRIEAARDQAVARIQMEKDTIAEELFEELTRYVRAR